MKTYCSILVLIIVSTAIMGRANAAPPALVVSLPAPRTDGGVSVERALKERRSNRSPATTPLTMAEIGQLCWAAQGVSDDKGHRTAPSARATYPLELYLIAHSVEALPSGLYHYEPARHALALVAIGDRRDDFVHKAVGQEWIKRAPAVFIIVGNAERTASMKERGPNFMWVEAGLAAQGFFLEATAMGLGSTYVGGFSPSAAHAALSLPPAEQVLGVLPVGRK